MMTESDHRTCEALFNRSDVTTSRVQLMNEVLAALAEQGIELAFNNVAISFDDFRTSHKCFLRSRDPDPENGVRLSAVVKTVVAVNGQIDVSLEFHTREGIFGAVEIRETINLFRSEPVETWNLASDPIEALRQGIANAGFLESSNWKPVAQHAAQRANEFFQY